MAELDRYRAKQIADFFRRRRWSLRNMDQWPEWDQSFFWEDSNRTGEVVPSRSQEDLTATSRATRDTGWEDIHRECEAAARVPLSAWDKLIQPGSGVPSTDTLLKNVEEWEALQRKREALDRRHQEQLRAIREERMQRENGRS